MKKWLLFLSIVSAMPVFGQTVTTNPAVPDPSLPVTITFDVTGTDFASKNLNDVWLWAWLEKGAADVNAPTNVNPATDAQSAAKVTRSTSNANLYSITITATTFFNKPASEISQVGVIIKGRDWSNGQTADKFITFSSTFTIAFSSPAKSSFFVNTNEHIPISVATNKPSQINIKVNGVTVASSAPAAASFNYEHIVTEMTGYAVVDAEAIGDGQITSKSFIYVLRTETIEEARPPGIVDGINYLSPTQVTLCLWAPGKTSVYALGDFNDWMIVPAYRMKRDGERFWLTIDGLSPQQEYGFQYLINETIRCADPYADKILDPDDQSIPTSTYPNLKPYPAKALNPEWYFNRVSVLQTGQTSYNWANNNFQKPTKEKLVIYELLIRDFFDNMHRNYQTLIDTLSYIKRLGVNAIELMPIMEFNGNESWGYNPTFMFAPDKYYGTKNKLKEFVDRCHANGIAVILDIAMNHQDLPNPYVMMDFDFVNNKPTPSNKWFNVNATHPYNVFFDMNHESPYTKKYLDTVTYYWLHEYKVDGFRFDLSKGFTQTNNPDNVNAWSAYDPSRVAILKRMADKIWSHTPDAYIILEHFAANDEEKELAEYRIAEGKGMMLWGKMTDPYNQLTMGYSENSDISGILSTNRGWSTSHLVGFMESHDEERLMVKNKLYGSQNTNYSTKDEETALSRMRAANTIFLTLPGPKMIWQFGELGYDYSINYCENGTTNDGCRISPKPVKWDYLDNDRRYWLYSHVSDLNRLRNTYAVFSQGNATLTSGAGLVKQIVLKNDPYTATPSSTSQMNAVVVANFDIVEKNVSVQFPHTGTWFDYYAASTEFPVTTAAVNVILPPGGYRIYTDVAIAADIVMDVPKGADDVVTVFPNPATDYVYSTMPSDQIVRARLTSLNGVQHEVATNESRFDVRGFPPGVYVLEIVTRDHIFRKKIIKSDHR